MMANFHKICCLIFYFIIQFYPIYSLYEDQIGKFDWIQRYIGPVENIVFDKSSSPSRRVLVSTGHNVLAALSTKSGDIIWRHILEPTEVGKIEAMVANDDIISIIAGNLLRTFDVVSAALKEEIVLQFNPFWSDTFGHYFSFASNNEELFLVKLSNGRVDIQTFDVASGASVSFKAIKEDWCQSHVKCGLAEDSLVCLDLVQGNIQHLTLSDSSFSSTPVTYLNIDEITLQQAAANPTSTAVLNVSGSQSHLLLKIGNKKKLIHVHKSGIHIVKDVSGSQTVAIDGDVLFTISQELKTVTVQATELSSGNEYAEQGIVTEMPPQSGSVQSASAHRFTRKDGATAMRILVSCSDHSIHMISTAGVVWSREESLASVLLAEAVDLPVAGAAASYQDQLSFEAGVLSGTLHRLRSQLGQIIGWFDTLVGKSDEFDSGAQSLTRDAFNLHKLIIVVTKSGKVLAIDNWSGGIIWSIFLPSIIPFSNNKILLFTQRTSAHFPRNPQCILVGKHQATNEGIVFSFNPLTGEGIGDGGGIVPLGYPLMQASLLQQSDEDYLKPVLLIDNDLQPHIYPPSGEAVLLQWKHELFVHLSIPGSSIYSGYTLRHSKPGNLLLSEAWKISLATSGVINGIYGKRSNDKVHCSGRVLADRSVLYKYSNPNLVIVTTFGQDHLSKNVLTVHLVDTVTGTVLESVSHKRVLGPFHFVHSENWVVYTYYNEKFRRHEVTTLEFFEGLRQSNSTAFSSFGAKATPPIVEKQAFIMPQGVQATTHTTTEKGITTKFILFALNTGNVIQMSKWFLDPRRPTQSGPREEGLIPYMPELSLPPQEMINYNFTLPRVAGIYTAPTGLESACIVLIYGLDLFYTRIFPSKMFDVLKDDFDHYLILGAVLMLLTASIVTRKLAQRKALKQAWK